MISKRKLEKMKVKIPKCNLRKVNQNKRENKTKMAMVAIVDMKKKRMMRKMMKTSINN